jgi:hypothetical protein
MSAWIETGTHHCARFVFFTFIVVPPRVIDNPFFSHHIFQPIEPNRSMLSRAFLDLLHIEIEHRGTLHVSLVYMSPEDGVAKSS